MKYVKRHGSQRSFTCRALALGALFSLSCAQAWANASVSDTHDLTLGIGGRLAPEYSGSDKSQVSPIPVIHYQHASGFFASTLDGLGYKGEISRLTYSAALYYREGRKAKDLRDYRGKTGRLKGMGDVEWSATVQVGAGLKLGEYVHVSAIADMPVSESDNGNALQIGADATFLQTQRHHLAANAALHVGDSRYMKTYYGVSHKQSLRTGLHGYTPDAGLYALSTELTWTYNVASNWHVITQGGVTTLVRDAAKGPLVQRKTAPTAGVYVTYAF